MAQRNGSVGIGQVKSVGSVLKLWIFVQGAVKEMSEAPKNVCAHTQCRISIELHKQANIEKEESTRS